MTALLQDAAAGPGRLASSADGASAIRAPLPILFALAVFIGLLCTQAIFNDPDTLWHLKAGEWMIDHRAVPNADPFSHTFAGQPWTAHEWLSEILMAAVLRLAGWNGLMIATAGAAAASIFILGRFASRHMSGLGLLMMLLLCCALASPHLLARPHILVLPLLCLWATQLAGSRTGNGAPSLWLCLAMMLWANMHGSFVLGLGLIAPFALEALMDAPKEKRRIVFQSWLLFGVAAVAAAIVTPHGLEGLIFPLKLMLMPGIEGINEWKPADFSTISALELALVAALFAIMRFKVSVPVIRLLLLLGFLHLALKHQRHEIVLGVFAVVILAEPMARAMAADAGRALTVGAASLSRAAAAGIALAFAVATILRLGVGVPEINTVSTPRLALAATPPELRALPVLNDYDFGGYLISEGVRPFIDGRADLYGPAFLQRYFAIMGPDRAFIDAALEEYAIRWTLLRRQSAAARAMDAAPGWALFYADEDFVVHIKVAEAGRAE